MEPSVVYSIATLVCLALASTTCAILGHHKNLRHRLEDAHTAYSVALATSSCLVVVTVWNFLIGSVPLWLFYVLESEAVVVVLVSVAGVRQTESALERALQP